MAVCFDVTYGVGALVCGCKQLWPNDDDEADDGTTAFGPSAVGSGWLPSPLPPLLPEHTTSQAFTFASAASAASASSSGASASASTYRVTPAARSLFTVRHEPFTATGSGSRGAGRSALPEVSLAKGDSVVCAVM